MPSREDVIELYSALSSGNIEGARRLAPMFGPALQEGIERDPGKVLSTIESLADRKGISLPFTGGATREWQPETAGRVGAFKQGIRRGMFAGGSPLGVGPVPGEAPVTGLAENTLQALGMATPMVASYLTGGLAAEPLAARAATATGPGIIAAIQRAFGPGLIRTLLGSAGFEGTGVATGVREPMEALQNVGLETAILGPGASLARRAIPGAGGAVRRSFAARRGLQDLYSGLTPAQARGTLAQSAARRVTRGEPVQGVTAGYAGAPGGQRGAPSITQQGSEAIDAELAAVRDPTGVLVPETTKAARKVGTEVVPRRQILRETTYGPKGQTRKMRETITEPYESPSATKAKAKKKPPTRKKATTKPQPPKRKRKP